MQVGVDLKDFYFVIILLFLIIFVKLNFFKRPEHRLLTCPIYAKQQECV